MKKGIHPEYKETTITCACGEVIHTRSTKQNIKIDICSKCHPFFTGQSKFVDTLGQVDRFVQKKIKSEKQAEHKKKDLEFRASKKIVAKTDKPTLKDLLMQARKNLPKAS